MHAHSVSVSMYASYSCASPVQVSNNPISSRNTVILTLILGSEMALYGPWIVPWQEEHRIMTEQSVFCSSCDHCEWVMVKKSLFLKTMEDKCLLGGGCCLSLERES